MTSIDPHHRITALLRQQAAAVRGKGAAAPAAAAAPSSAAAAPARCSARGAAGVPAAVALRIDAIAPDDPRRRHTAVRMFLEDALLRELGSGLVHDARFPAMVDAVQQALQDDAELARAVDQLGDLLLSA